MAMITGDLYLHTSALCALNPTKMPCVIPPRNLVNSTLDADDKEDLRQSLTKTELGKGGRIESAETDPGG